MWIREEEEEKEVNEEEKEEEGLLSWWWRKWLRGETCKTSSRDLAQRRLRSKLCINFGYRAL
jgi:hypothetical protein